MTIYNVPRQTGKTTECVKRLIEDENVMLIVPQEQIKQRILESNNLTYSQSRRVRTAFELKRGYIPNGCKFIFDELEICLSIFFGNFDGYMTTYIKYELQGGKHETYTDTIFNTLRA